MATTAKKPKDGITDRLAYVLRDLVELVPDQDTCRACMDATRCPLHRRAIAAREVLKEYEA